MSLAAHPYGRQVTSPEELAAKIERRLSGLGTPQRAAAEKAYLKSSLEFAGVPVPGIRRVVRELLPRPGRRAREHPGREYVVATAEALWRRPVHECRMAAVMVLTDHAGVLEARDAALLERLIRESGTWALVLRDTARRHPGLVAGWLAPRLSRVSGVTLREAVKPLPPETAAHLLAGYHARHSVTPAG